MAPLNSLKTGEVGVVQDLNSGRGFISRAVALGFTPGTEVAMVQNFRRSPLIVVVRDTHSLSPLPWASWSTRSPGW